MSFLLLTRKGPWQLWRELVRLVAVNQTRVEETVLYSVVTRSQATPQETLSRQGPVFIGHPSVSLRSLMLGFRASEGVGLCQDREGGGRGLTFGDLSTLPLTHCIHV